jgi:hypothetical protein
MRIAGFLFVPLFSVSSASAQVEMGATPSFEHDALRCMSPGEFPVVEAVFDGAESRSLRKAQVYFKARRTDAWYFVEMEREEETRLRAILPKPLAETDRVHYYLFFLSGSFATWQSEEYSVQVSETGCEAIPAAGTTSPVSLTLRATVANQAPVPPGFQPQGITGLVTTAGNTVAVGSASGGLSGIAVGVVAGGGAAIAGAVAIAGGNGGDGPPGSSQAGQPPGGGAAPTSSTGPSPAPTGSPGPSPAPSVPDVSGTWQITDRIVESCIPSLVGQTSNATMVIQQSGSLLTASLSGPDFSGNLAGTIDASGKLSMAGQFVDDRDAGEVRVEASTTSGTDMTGNYTQFYPQYGCTVRGTFSGSKR